jgi:hypothetical protein
MKRKHFNRNKKAVVVVRGTIGRRIGGGRWWWGVENGDRGSEAMVEIRNGKTARVNDGTRHRPPGTNIKS